MVEDEGNLTGGQIEEVMDTLLYNALEPIVRYTTIFDTQLIYLLVTVTKNRKRKVCAIDREKTVPYICMALCSENPEDKLMYIRKLKIERSFIHVFLKRFLEKYKDPFFNLYYKFMSDPKNRITHRRRLSPYMRSVGCDSRSEMYVALSTCETNLNKFYFYFGKVVSQYYQLCYTQAKRLVETNPNNTYDFDDIVQNFKRKVVIGLNKYNSDSGALTSYLKWWVYNGITCGSHEHEYGIAYVVPQNHKKKMSEGNGSSVNFSVSMDSMLNEDDDNIDMHDVLANESLELDDETSSQDIADRLHRMAKNADPLGIARLVMDIPEVFSSEEYAQMKAALSKTVNN